MAISGRVLVYSQTTAQDKTAQPATANGNGVPSTVIPNDEGSLQIGEAAGTGGQHTQGTINFWTLFRLILVLGLSVAAIYGIVYGLKKLARPAEARDPYLRVLGTTHLGSNRFVHIVAVGTKAWLIGSSDGSVQPIAEITDKELLDAMFLDESKKLSESGKSGKDFASILRRFIPNQKTPETTIDLNAERLRKQRERLRGL